MIEQLGKILHFKAFFTDITTHQGATGLTVTVDVYKNNVKIITAAAATEVGGGLYRYDLAGSYNDTITDYIAVFHTAANTVDVKDIPSEWVVTQWAETIQDIYDLLHGPGATRYYFVVQDERSNPLDHVKFWATSTDDPTNVIAGVWLTDTQGRVNAINGTWFDPGTLVYLWLNTSDAHLDLPQTVTMGSAGTGLISGTGTALNPYVIQMTASTIGMGPSFLDLQTALRQRLNDVDKGNYTDAEIKYCLNLAYRETQEQAKCNKRTVDVTLLPLTHTYYTDSIFEPVEVSIVTGGILKKKTLADMGVSLETWNRTAAGTPAEWMNLYGSYIRVYPTPSAGGTLRVHGYGVMADMVNDDDYPNGVPIGYAASSILDRAEAEARKMRITYANNGNMAGALMQSWGGWVDRIKKAIEG